MLDENKGELAPVPAPSGEGAAGETVGGCGRGWVDGVWIPLSCRDVA